MAAEPTTERLLSDFATIFAHMWYRDFPLQRSLRDKARRADWTTHIGIAVRSTADLMGLFTHFESGVRTDAELCDNARGVVAALEWEWDALHTLKVKEFKKLAERCQNAELPRPRFVGLVVYGRTDGTYSVRTRTVLEEFERDWPKDLPPLLLVVIYFEGIGKEDRQEERLQRRQFGDMQVYKIADGNKMATLRQQRALPWDVKGSRWAKEAIEPSLGSDEAL